MRLFINDIEVDNYAFITEIYEDRVILDKEITIPPFKEIDILSSFPRLYDNIGCISITKIEGNVVYLDNQKEWHCNRESKNGPFNLYVTHGALITPFRMPYTVKMVLYNLFGKNKLRVAKRKYAEWQKAVNEQQARVAEYESQKRQRAAEAAKTAGVAEQKATIEVSKARGEAAQAEAEAEKIAGTSKVEAQMAIEKTKQERQVEVNEAAALAAEAKLTAEVIVPAQKQKEKITIDAEAVKQKAILEAEAEAAKILKEAEAKADATKLQMEAEAEGTRKKLLAEAEGKRASLMAEAEKIQAIEMAPALAVKEMIANGMTPDMVVNYKAVDQYKDIAEASARMYEHIKLGNVTVYGNENTAAQFMTSIAESVSPMLKTLESIPFKGTFNNMFGNKPAENHPEQPVVTEDEKPFEEVK